MTLPFVAGGLDHRHIHGMIEDMTKIAARCLGYWSKGAPQPIARNVERFSDLPRFATHDDALGAGAGFVLVSEIPADRAALSTNAMQARYDVMIDNPVCTTLDHIKATVADIGRIWSIIFSERVEVPCVTLAEQLGQDGATGRMVHITGLGAHHLNRCTRPDRFFQHRKYGGVLIDIASHRSDQRIALSRPKDHVPHGGWQP